jgi:hypothetical protein
VIFRVLFKVLILLSASVFAYSLWVVGIRDSDNIKLLGGSISLVLALSVSLSLFFDFKR